MHIHFVGRVRMRFRTAHPSARPQLSPSRLKLLVSGVIHYRALAARIDAHAMIVICRFSYDGQSVRCEILPAQKGHILIMSSLNRIVRSTTGYCNKD